MPLAEYVKGLSRYCTVLCMQQVDSIRIGELARRTGVSPELLRAWEQRYGLLEPTRSNGGFRLYSERDERRVRTMRALIARGLSAAEAATRARADEADVPPIDAPALARIAAHLRQALDDFDAERAHVAFDRLLATVSTETAIAEVVVPYLHELGDRWEGGDVTVAQEHFASNFLRGRLLGLARDWAVGPGTPLVLACPPGEEHDLGLVMFGIVAGRRGHRIVFLGANTPIEMIGEALSAFPSAGVVLTVSRPELLEVHAEELRALASRAPVQIAGPGATSDRVEALGAQVLEGGPVEAARAGV